MGYVKVRGDLPDLFDPTPFRDAGHDICADMAEEGRRAIARNTPVKTGKLRASWRTTRVHRVAVAGGHGWEAKVYTSVRYAPWVEEGTGLWGRGEYDITPKKGTWLRWRDPASGRWVYARRVRHPGSPGNHMAKIGAAWVERSVGEIAAPTLARLALGGRAGIQ